MNDCPQGSHRDLGPICFNGNNVRHADRQHRSSRNMRDSYNTFGGLSSDRKPLDTQVLRKLSQLIESTQIESQFSNALSNDPTNGRAGIPAGYTYLFQIVAHDLVNTVIPSGPGISPNVKPRNARRVPLALETIFGDGPIGCPFAYDRKGDAPRLRTGFVKTVKRGGWVWSDPARDLPRTAFCTSGKYVPKDNGLETVLIPDSRNDDNMLLAQMTVLLHGIYNYFTDELCTTKKTEKEYISETARQLLVRIYRRIVRYDLLSRILHPDIYKLYATEGPLRLDRASADGSSSIEFAFAAGRLGHSMVREKYSLNNDNSLDLKDIIRISSRHFPKELPIGRFYLVDWSLFFPSERGTVPSSFNWAIRFGPHVSNALKLKVSASTPVSGSSNGDMVGGTTFRDLMRENSWPLITVKQLVDYVLTRPPFGGWSTVLDAVISPESREYIVDLGLYKLEAQAAGQPHQALKANERAAVVANPPLSLFFQFEAQLLGCDGSTLGPLGSLIVAEAMWPAFAPEHWEDEEDPLGRLEEELLGCRPDSMPQFLQSLRRKAPSLFVT